MTISFATTKLQNPNGLIVKKVFSTTRVKRFRTGAFCKLIFVFCATVLCAATLRAQTTQQRWVDSVFQKLNTTEKIGQLFMMPVSSSATKEEINIVSAHVKKYKPGSLLITNGSPVRHVRLLNTLQSLATTPMLVGMRGEQGVASVIDSTIRFAQPLQVGATNNADHIFALGKEIGRQMNLLGVHVQLSLNADIHVADDLYPATLRYYGDDKHQVTNRLLPLMKGLQQEHILASVNHIGNPIKERHLATGDSSQILFIEQLDTIGFYPYQQLLQRGVDGVVTSHLDFVLPGKKKALLASVSDLFVAEVIQKKLGYEGLIMTEMPYFKKASRKKRAGAAELLAFEVGHDILIDPSDMGRGIKQIAKAIKKSKSLQRQLDASVKKILAAKYKAGLHQRMVLDDENLYLKLHIPEAKIIQRQLMAEAVTVLKNDKALVPMGALENRTFASLSIGHTIANELNTYLAQYAEFEKYAITQMKDTVGLQPKLKGATTIVVAIYPAAKGITLQVARLVAQLAAHHEVILCSFGDAEDVRFFQNLPTLIAAYTDDQLTQQAAAEIIFGGLAAKGQLPITISEQLRVHHRMATDTLDRLAYALPEEVGMSSTALAKIKTIMQEAIDIGATPGCQVVVARHGKIVYQQSAGWLTYDKKQPVTNETIYDLASVTKVTATLQTILFMHEWGLIDINKKISVYLPELKESNKKDMTIKDILTHQAGLWPFLPFWAKTVKDSSSYNTYYRTKKSDAFPFAVADSLYAHRTMKDSLWQWIVNARVREKIPRTVYDYKYSDMGFYMLQHLAEKIVNQPMDEFLTQHIYHPLGAYTLGYLPREKFAATRIAPTENDQQFRKRLLVGYVHDQGAAMHGGIAGHAGLFGSAVDLAKMGQMWLRQGRYGGQQFFKPETLALFTAKQYDDSRRGLGWDKPIQSDADGPTSVFASSETFGHTGFTGTCVWVDPAFDVVFVFLSNRVYPDMTNNRILNASIRPRIQDAIYRAMFEYGARKH